MCSQSTMEQNFFEVISGLSIFHVTYKNETNYQKKTQPTASIKKSQRIYCMRLVLVYSIATQLAMPTSAKTKEIQLENTEETKPKHSTNKEFILQIISIFSLRIFGP